MFSLAIRLAAASEGSMLSTCTPQGPFVLFHAKAATGIALSSRKYLLSYLQNKENFGFCKIIILHEFNSCGVYYTYGCIPLCSPRFGVVCHGFV